MTPLDVQAAKPAMLSRATHRRVIGIEIARATQAPRNPAAGSFRAGFLLAVMLAAVLIAFME